MAEKKKADDLDLENKLIDSMVDTFSSVREMAEWLVDSGFIPYKAMHIHLSLIYRN